MVYKNEEKIAQYWYSKRVPGQMCALLLVALSTLILFFNFNCLQPTEPEHITCEEAINIVIMEILKGDTTSVKKAMISKEIVPPNTVVVYAEPQVITPEYKTWAVYLYYGLKSGDEEDEFDIQWVIINAKTGDYYIIDHWYFRWNIEIKYIVFIG